MMETKNRNERPILFSGPMVRAILENRKTQTRRVVKPQPKLEYLGYMMTSPAFATQCGSDYPDDATDDVRCPYGQPGDRLWVRETFLIVGSAAKDGNHRVVYAASNDGPDAWVSPSWQPSIFMPRWASRITLEITKIRVERLHHISEADAIAEGCIREGDVGSTEAYRYLWDSINAKRGYGWNKNPWVWVVEFKQENMQQ